MVWFDEGTISKILYFSRIREKYPFCYDTEGKYFSIMKLDKEVLFRQIPSGLYFQETSNRDVVLINTILDRREGSYQWKYNDTKQAQHALSMVGYPTEKHFKYMMLAGMITNWPGTLDDINNKNKIFGQDAP